MSELEFWKDLGNIFDSVMNYQKKNVEFNNRFINPWIRLGNVFERQDQANDAVQAYQRATELDPDSPQNWVELGDAQFKKGDYDEAVGSYNTAVTLDPEAGWPLGNLALSMVMQGKIEEAVPLYKKSIELLTEVKDKAICWNRLGNAYRKLNDYENAFLAFQKADQLDGDNTGFSDKLDEVPSNTSVVASEEILDQLIIDQAPAEVEAAPVALEVQAEVAEPIEAVEEMEAGEAVEPISEPEAVLADSETPVDSAIQEEVAEEITAILPNMEIVAEELPAEEEAMIALGETTVEQSSTENTVEEEEETPLTLHEKKFNLIQIVENVIAKVEQAYAEQRNSAVKEEQESETIAEETNSSAPTGELEVESTSSVSEETVQEIEQIAIAEEDNAIEVQISEENESVLSEVEAVEESEVAVLESDAVETSTAVSPEVEFVAMDEQTELVEVEAIATNEQAELVEVETTMASEETKVEAESTAPETEAVAAAESEAVSEEEIVEAVAPKRIPEWLVIHNAWKVNASEPTVDANDQQDIPQVEAAMTLSDISQEAAISESTVNMDVVETYTEPLAVQAVEEVEPGEILVSSETADQVESVSEPVAAEEAQEINTTEESIPAVVSEDLPAIVTEEQITEMAYEEYLKDIVEPVKLTDEMQGEVPATKVSKNGEMRIEMDTKNAHVWNELGNIYLNAGTCDEAIASYSKAIELDRHFAWPYSNLALAYVQKGRFAEAILLYQRGIELFTTDRDKAITWNRLGNVYRRINDYSNAIASYQTADELDPENATLSLRSSFGLLGNMYSDKKPAYIE